MIVGPRPEKPQEKFFVVAELGVNWGGSKARMHAMMAEARDAGADAVKFQAFLPEHVAGHPRAEELLKSSLDVDMAEYAETGSHSLGIEWFCTPFYPEAVDWLEEFKVKRYKIREKDGREFPKDAGHPLLQKVLATGKEVFISTRSVPITPLYLRHHPQIRWLYCVPSYPPRLEELSIWNVSAHDGYSNHYPSPVVPLTAGILGAKIIEVHATMSHDWPDPDADVSLDFRELKTLVESLRLVEKMRL